MPQMKTFGGIFAAWVAHPYRPLLLLYSAAPSLSDARVDFVDGVSQVGFSPVKATG
ncbi:hypothetical protein HYPBUDRAFT_153496 [Hyphopichia burtonii NRRL Y-1933]|uniref:Uncharacterized protein n=1 Tax=Hyphopichia burtonii NRRL Y-1933 TaxID=984485 RepID=A0A1E4RF77_9ASCO|nr:hypothetical protein HYPBUDRAFT_153496 [Hyphopichia burtonii NRRL Y-1933]ODV65881.1 hypothetical protein HYPBUDRAFT_153496 [Hyphopichia burtonii NRRL Y-1933]